MASDNLSSCIEGVQRQINLWNLYFAYQFNFIVNMDNKTEKKTKCNLLCELNETYIVSFRVVQAMAFAT